MYMLAGRDRLSECSAPGVSTSVIISCVREKLRAMMSKVDHGDERTVLVIDGS
jgi:hypothetical protein